jgi:hypothetical protein
MQTPPKSTAEPQPVECPKLERPSLKRSRSESIVVAIVEPQEPTQEPTPEPTQEPTPEPKPASSSFEAFVEEVVDAVAGELAHNFMERIVSALTSRRTSPRALLAIIDELHAMPHAKIPGPSNKREAHVRHMILMDKLLEATQKAHANAKLAWNRTPWERQHGANFCVLDGETEDPEGKVIPDGCGICGVAKTECMKPDEHFGARGESPPDSVCSHCSENFYNRYNSAHNLQLHVAEKHAAKE